MEPHNPIDNCFIACRLPVQFKDRVVTFAEKRDLTISQLVRKGLKQLLDAEAETNGWSVKR